MSRSCSHSLVECVACQVVREQFERECWYCALPIDHEIGVRVYEDGPEFAHSACSENAAERAWDRSVEDFYGSDSPQTERERYGAAAEEKKRFG